MPANRAGLKLVSGGAATGTRVRRATRRTPVTDPVTEVLSRLDEEPAVLSGRSKPRLRIRPLPTVLVALVCAAAVLAGLFGQRWYAAGQLDRAHQQATAAAKQTTVNFVSVSAATVDRDLQRIVDGAGGDFKDEFTRGQAQVRAAVVENAVESQGTVLRAALVSGDRRFAVVLLAVDATVRNAKAPDGRVSHYRIQVEVSRDKDSGRWLVTRLQFVG